MKSIGFGHAVFLTTATVWMIMGTFFYLRQGIIEYHFSNTKTVLGTSVQFNPSPNRVRQNWRIFENPFKGYRFSYPSEWSIEEKNGFINSTHIYPPGREFEIIYSQGEIPNIPGRIAEAQDSILMEIQGNKYKIEEKVINNKQKLFHITIDHPTIPFDITARTLHPDFNVYESNRQTILDIIATTEFIPVATAVDRAGFTEFFDLGFRMYYPKGLQITSRTESEIVWGDQLFMVHKQPTDYAEIKNRTVVQFVQNPSISNTVQNFKTEDTYIAGEILTKKHTINCGKNCSYQLVRFPWSSVFYEFVFKGTGKAERRVFDDIIDRIRLE